ncbi:unnamed protein product [Rotaria sp. Silwood2]|nr:unnamed protein product [Rotaria sp. Silwood2]
MADQERSYYPGRGLPPYLLCRQGDESSKYSDGASRVFAYSLPTISANDTSYSSISRGSASVSSSSTWLDDTESHTTFNSLTSNPSIRRDSQSTINFNRDHDGDVKKNYGTSASGIDVLANSMMLASGFMTSNNGSMNECGKYDFDPECCTVPEHMFPHYVPYHLDDEEVQRRDESPEKMDIDATEDSIIILPDPVLEAVNYEQCYYFQWKPRCLTFQNLAQSDIREHLKRLGVVKNIAEDNIIVNERNLIVHRLLGKNVLVDDAMSICPKHRSSFGVDWCDVVSKCNHPDHDPKHRPSASDCRRASLALCSKIEGFQIGGRLCSKHRKIMAIPEDFVSTSALSYTTNATPFIIEDTREQINRILVETDASPIRSQARVPLKHQSKSSLRRLLSKLNREKLAESLAPGQRDELIEMSPLCTRVQKQQQTKMAINDDIINNLKEIYNMRSDREHHQFPMCPVSECTTTFESNVDLDSHITANLHKISLPNPRTSNDIARLHLVETARSTNIPSVRDKNQIKQNQNTSTEDKASSVDYQHLSSVGWALRTCKHSATMNVKTKTFIENIWLKSQETRVKLTLEQVQQQMRTQRDQSTGDKLFQPHEYATTNQIKYRFQKLGAEYGITAKQELIADLIDENVEQH